MNNKIEQKKSTSDESYTLELEEQSLIASATTKIEKMAAAAAAAMAAASYPNSDDVNYSNNSIYRLTSGGQFGFNPISLGILPSSSASSIKPIKRVTFAGRIGKTGTQCGLTNSAASRRPVKRLLCGTRFFADHSKKNSHNDCKNMRLGLLHFNTVNC